MPCRGPEPPNSSEKYRQNTAINAVYALTELEKPIPSWLLEAAGNEYCHDQRATPFLCDLIKAMNKEQQDAIIYNARSASSRRLADWWENHQETDRKRKADEAAKVETDQLRKRALAKLTPAEKAALGLS